MATSADSAPGASQRLFSNPAFNPANDGESPSPTALIPAISRLRRANVLDTFAELVALADPLRLVERVGSLARQIGRLPNGVVRLRLAL
jgi:hypothetical protein